MWPITLPFPGCRALGLWLARAGHPRCNAFVFRRCGEVPTGAGSATYPAWSRAAGTPDEPGPSPAELSYDAALFVLPVAQPYDESLAPVEAVQRTPDADLSALSGFPGAMPGLDGGGSDEAWQLAGESVRQRQKRPWIAIVQPQQRCQTSHHHTACLIASETHPVPTNGKP